MEPTKSPEPEVAEPSAAAAEHARAASIGGGVSPEASSPAPSLAAPIDAPAAPAEPAAREAPDRPVAPLSLGPPPTVAAVPTSSLAAAAPRRDERLPSATGQLSRWRSGWVRALQLCTGLALLRWLALAIAGLLGYRHTATLAVSAGGLELRGERRLMGASLGATRQLIPLAAVRRVSLVGEAALGAMIAAIGVLAAVSVVGSVLVLWGVVGRQPSWLGIAGLVIGAGVFLDGVAHLLLRRSVARALVSLEIQAGGRRYRLAHVPQRAADALLDRLASR